MTREEMLNECISRDRAIVQLNHLQSDWDDDWNIAIRKCIEAIKKLPSVTPQSCGDCISREAVMHILDEVGGDFDSPREAVVPIDYIADMVSELPPVTPKQRTSVWVAIDQEPHETWECGLCGFVIDGSGCVDPDEYRDIYKYCPNCGAKMSEIPTGAEGSEQE